MQKQQLLKKISTTFNKYMLGVVGEAQNLKSAPGVLGKSNQGFCTGFFLKVSIPEEWVLNHSLNMTKVSHYDLATIDKIELVKKWNGYDLRTKGAGHRNAPNSIKIARGITKEEGLNFLKKYKVFGQETIKRRQEEDKKCFSKKVVNTAKVI